MKIHSTIIEPITTEKSTSLSDKGKYVFLVNKNATKVDVKNAIRLLYDVEVSKVNITQIRPKTRLMKARRLITKRNEAKKATVTIKAGKSLDVTKFKKPKAKKK